MGVESGMIMNKIVKEQKRRSEICKNSVIIGREDEGKKK
jgi:hypothetical protein